MRTLLSSVIALIVLALPAASVSADDPAGGSTFAAAFADAYAMGISAHDLDSATQVIGWRLSDSWYIGARDEKGADDGLSLVWRGERKQMSLSLEEIRFVRRF
ncbi:MAG: hypothetical protein U5Q16_04130 [Gammaproteobacteria bacterium]|nr:hypothetical protein [Gammaproteobacteria bacterium]